MFANGAVRNEQQSNQSSQLLIDFDEPSVAVSAFASYACKSPLIPCPGIQGSSPGDNNPFDLMVNVAQNVNVPEDPFESTSFSPVRNGRFPSGAESAADPVQTRPVTNSAGLEADIISKRVETKPVVTAEKIEHKPEVDEPMINNASSIDISNMNSDIDGSPNISLHEASISLSKISNETDLKKMIAHRVSTCIQRALNSSCSQTDLRTAVSENPRTLAHSRSMSDANIRRDILPEPSFKEPRVLFNSSFSGMNRQQSKCPEADLSPRSKDHNRRLEGSILLAESKNPAMCSLDNLLPQSEMKIVFEEAKKLSIMFSELAKSSSRADEPFEDLMSIEPPWADDPFDLCDEEDEAGLPTLKLYHVRRSKAGNLSRTSSDSEALVRFKNRHRASLDLSATDIENENAPEKVRRAVSDSSLHDKSLPEVHEKEAPSTKTAVQPTILPAEAINLKLRPKKPTSDPPRKGPLKAMMPLQKMTRKIVEKISSPLKAYQKSPLRIKGLSGSAKKLSTPKDNSFSAPVAASTPNKQNKLVSPSPNKLSESHTTPKSRLSRRNSGGRNELSKRSSSETRNVQEGRPKTALSPVVNSRVLTELQKPPYPELQSSIKKLTGKLVPKMRRSGSVPAQGKENQVF